MNSEFDDLERRLGSATRDLRTQIDNTDIPEFRPPNDGLRAIAIAAAMALIAFFGWSIISEDQPSDLDTVDNPEVENNSPQLEDPAVVDEETEEENEDGFIPDISNIPGPSAQDLIIGFDTTAPAEEFGPAALGEFLPDPAYGTTIRRIVNPGDETAVVASTSVSPENADGSHVLVLRNGQTWEAIDRATLAPQPLNAVGRRSEPHWHPEDPNQLRHFPDEADNRRLRVLASNLDGSTETVADLTDQLTEVFPDAAALTSGTGQDPATDGTYAWAVLDEQGNVVGLVSYNIDQDTILGTTALTTDDSAVLDSVRVSPSGTHVLLGFQENSDVFDVVVYDVALEERRVLVNQRDRGGALVSMTDGADALITVNLTSDPPTGGWIYWTDLDTGEVSLLYDLFDGANTSVSFSASPDRPGWAVLSTFTCRGEGAWSCNKLVAVHLESGTLVNLAHTYLCAAAGDAIPAASVTNSFERIYFNSDSNLCGPIEARELTVPPDIFDLRQ